jgi:hypothetical protein
LIRPYTQLGCGPKKPQRKERQDRDADHRDDEVGSDLIRHALHRRPAALRLADHLHDLRRTVFEPIDSARITRAPLVFMVAPMSLSPARLDTGIGSPVSIGFVDRAAAFDDGAVDGHLSRPGARAASRRRGRGSGERPLRTRPR